MSGGLPCHILHSSLRHVYIAGPAPRDRDQAYIFLYLVDGNVHRGWYNSYPLFGVQGLAYGASASRPTRVLILKGDNGDE